MRTKSSLGQNFLIDESVLKRIANLFEVKDSDLILEIGPGMGALTKYLVKKACPVYAYEIDERMKSYLTYNNLNVFYGDFLACDLANLPGYDNLYVVSNIPYYITTPIIEHILSFVVPFKMILLVQKEVAKRFSASCGSKDYGMFTVFLQHFFNISIMFDVCPSSFLPMPKVMSSVIMFERKEIIKDIDVNSFVLFLKKAFSNKRKILKNNLSEYWDKIEPILVSNNISLMVRAEDLSYEMFVKLFEAI